MEEAFDRGVAQFCSELLRSGRCLVPCQYPMGRGMWALSTWHPWAILSLGQAASTPSRQLDQRKKREVEIPKGPVGTGNQSQYPRRDLFRRSLSILHYDLTSCSRSFPLRIMDAHIAYCAACFTLLVFCGMGGRERERKGAGDHARGSVALRNDSWEAPPRDSFRSKRSSMPGQHGAGVPAFRARAHLR